MKVYIKCIDLYNLGPIEINLFVVAKNILACILMSLVRSSAELLKNPLHMSVTYVTLCI